LRPSFKVSPQSKRMLEELQKYCASPQSVTNRRRAS
jgi:hypothetical protein